MKKVLVTNEVTSIIAKEKSFLDREGIQLFMVATNDDVRPVHGAEKTDVIITTLHAPGMRSEQLCSEIRSDESLRTVSIIILCPNNAADIERSEQCKANAVLMMPVTAAVLLEKMRQLLEISWRESYRVLVSVVVEGGNKDRPFFGRSGNISSTGMLIESEKLLEKGEQLVCSFYLPGSAQIKTTGEIMRVMTQTAGAKTYQYGLRFLQLTPEERSAIEDFVERKSQTSTSRK